MKRIRLNLDYADAGAFEEVADILKHQGAVVLPTDTLFALSVNALDEVALKRLFMIKKRSPKNPFPIFVKDLEMAKRYAVISEAHERLLASVWPGAVTVIFKKKPTLSDVLTTGLDTVGIRIPQSPFITNLFAYIDFPITATSANISGEAPLFSVDGVIQVFKDTNGLEPDAIVDMGDLEESVPSAIIDFTTNEPRFVRTGALTKEELEKLFERE